MYNMQNAYIDISYRILINKVISFSGDLFYAKYIIPNTSYRIKTWEEKYLATSAMKLKKLEITNFYI